MKAEEYDKLLSSAPNGWVMDYYAEEEEAKIGGYQILCSFSKGKVTMAGAYTPLKNTFPPMGEEHSSSYSIIDMQGPVLSFNTYNPVMHGFADPGTIFDMDGYAGDFEFVVINASDKLIEMKGVKHNLKIIMRPMEENKDWKEYCNEVKALETELKKYTRFQVFQSGSQIGMTTLVMANNKLHNTEEVNLEEAKYAVSNKGINLYNPIHINKYTLDMFTWDKENSKFVATGENAAVEMIPISLNYQQYLGTYKVMADNIEDPITVTISKVEGEQKLRVSKEFLGHEFDIKIVGDRLDITGQVLHTTPEGNNIRLGVYTTTSLIIAESAAYSATLPLSGSWFKGGAEKPELRFYPTTSISLIFVTYAWGFRVIEYKGTSTDNNNILSFKSPIYTNPIFTKQ